MPDSPADRAANIEKMMRQQAEAADHMSYAHGHHMLEYASRSLAVMAKSLEQGSPPQAAAMIAMRANTAGYLAQYDQWLTNWLNGHVSRESKLYEEATAILREQQSKATNGTKGA